MAHGARLLACKRTRVHAHFYKKSSLLVSLSLSRERERVLNRPRLSSALSRASRRWLERTKHSRDRQTSLPQKPVFYDPRSQISPHVEIVHHPLRARSHSPSSTRLERSARARSTCARRVAVFATTHLKISPHQTFFCHTSKTLAALCGGKYAADGDVARGDQDELSRRVAVTLVCVDTRDEGGAPEVRLGAVGGRGLARRLRAMRPALERLARLVRRRHLELALERERERSCPHTPDTPVSTHSLSLSL